MTISKTFCPAKWDEILVNLSADYVYSCCKSAPIKITRKEDIEHALNQQRTNLLNGIQDPACSYCWQVENQGYQSKRHEYLKNFDIDKLDQYKNNTVDLKQIEVSLGNECNFQCIYCNPKFSSQWESDVKNKSYNIYSDRYFYAVDDKNKNNITDTFTWLKNYNNVDKLDIIGGEPLQNKNFFKVINSIKSKRLGFTTNLSCKKTTIDKILDLSDRYEQIDFSISIDSTGKNAEFSRYGIDYQMFVSNTQYLINNASPNIKIIINSLMTSVTIRDIKNTIVLIKELYDIKPNNLYWNLSYCRGPKILTLDTLPEKFKPDILIQLDKIKDLPWVEGVDTLVGAIKESKFNKTLYNLMKHFLEEFSNRKKIIPIELE